MNKSSSRQKRGNEAISLLQRAVKHGLESRVISARDKDPDLTSLLGDPPFIDMVADAKKRAAPAQGSGAAH